MLILYFPLSPGPNYSCIRAKIQRRLRIITYLDVVVTVAVLTANSNDVNLVEPRNVLYANICLPPGKPCDIAFFLSVL